MEGRLRAVGKGIGHMTVAIFLREMRPVWPKADPRPTPLVVRAMKEFGIGGLREYVRKHGIDLVRLETALLRVAKDYLRRGKRIPV